MQLTVDSARCQGHNLCMLYVPELLDVDDEGFVSAKGGGDVPMGLRDKAVAAADNCPELAIRVTDSGTT